MGRIREAVEDILPGMASCKCPCESGITAATGTDHLVVAATGNWGAYGIEACLAGLVDDPNVMHDRTIETRVQEATARVGIVDPTTGLAEGWLDGMPPKASLNVVDQLKMTVDLQLGEPWQLRQWNRWSDRDDELKEAIETHGRRLRTDDEP
jgi:hypothetical protein